MLLKSLTWHYLREFTSNVNNKCVGMVVPKSPFLYHVLSQFCMLGVELVNCNGPLWRMRLSALCHTTMLSLSLRHRSYLSARNLHPCAYSCWNAVHNSNGIWFDHTSIEHSKLHCHGTVSLRWCSSDLLLTSLINTPTCTYLPTHIFIKRPNFSLLLPCCL